MSRALRALAFVSLWAAASLVVAVSTLALAADSSIQGGLISHQSATSVLQRVLLSAITIRKQSVSASSHAATCDWSVAGVCKVTLQGTSADTITLSNPITTASTVTPYRIQLVSGGAGTAVTWPASVHWPGGVAPVPSTTTGQIDEVGLLYDADRAVYDGGASLNHAP